MERKQARIHYTCKKKGTYLRKRKDRKRKRKNMLSKKRQIPITAGKGRNKEKEDSFKEFILGM